MSLAFLATQSTVLPETSTILIGALSVALMMELLKGLAGLGMALPPLSCCSNFHSWVSLKSVSGNCTLPLAPT